MSGTKWNGDAAIKQVRKGGIDGLRAAAKLVFDQSQREVPRDQSELAESGRYEVDESKMRAEIHYGEGLSDPRAVITHEELAIHHDQGNAKYLEGPLRALRKEVGNAIATNIKQELR